MSCRSRIRDVALAGLGLIALAVSPVATQAQPPVFAPRLVTPEGLAPFFAHVEPGSDAFVEEADAEAIAARLGALGAWLRGSGTEPALPQDLFAVGFKGARLWNERPSLAPAAGLEVRRHDADATASLDPAATIAHLRRLAAHLGAPTVTEFLVTALTSSAAPGAARPPSAGDRELVTEVRAEIVGQSPGGARAAHVGTWQMTWRRRDAGWRLIDWTAGAAVTSRAPTPLFREVTAQVVEPTSAAGLQFARPLDDWMARIDSVLTRDSNGHHGVSAGDADGDGLDDLYIAQPSGLPNRLLRGRRDGTFEDVTETSGVGLLDDTAQSLFADVDNDGDQDLILATSLQPLLLTNDGRGHFAIADKAFTFAAPLQGILTGVTMADFDRDGFLDAYLCVYSYFFGAGEEKAGTPMPYHDARNGPPGVLFRNDGRGHFVDVTARAGLDVGNDRYHFAATWVDFDADGWPDLFVANDFGTKNLYRNLGRQGDDVRFEDVAARAGVLDHGAGMSAAVLDYDNDGRLDLYAGNMWSAAGLRVTGAPAFMPDASPEVRAAYQHHARGNTLLRNRGDGTFDDTTRDTGAAMGRWAWSSDTLDFDSDGWQDLYIANGMLSRPGGGDLDGFFWRQVVARSPLTRVKGTPYDEAWRAINHLLVHGSIASRQRNVVLRNDGTGRFDDISGTTGLDLDQDGRAFAVLDADRDGDPDLAVMAARQAPQLRIFRNDHPARAVLAVRLTGTTSNRDAIGARVRVETEVVSNLKVVQAGSGFLSQHSRELLFGLGNSKTVRRLTVQWPSGVEQVFTDLPVDTRYRLTEAGVLEREPIPRSTDRDRSSSPPSSAASAPTRQSSPAAATWLHEPFPAPNFSATGLDGAPRSLAALRGRPALLLFWRSDAAASTRALATLAKARAGLDEARVQVLAIALDDPAQPPRMQALAPAGLAIVHATREAGLIWAIVHRHLFMNRPALPLPTALLLDGGGRIVAVYRDGIDAVQIARDAAAIEVGEPDRPARALPFPGAFHAPMTARNFLPYGRELLEEGFEAEAIVAFERAAQANPSASVLYRLGTLLAKTGQVPRARAAYEGALVLDPTLAEAHNDLGTLLAGENDLDGAITRFRQALTATPDYPDALNNLGYALLLSGREAEAEPLYARALTLQPDFPEALNNLGLLRGRAGDLDAAERHFRDALKRRPDFGDAANNLALVLVARDQADAAVVLLEDLVRRVPGFESAYVTIAKIHLRADRRAEGLRAVERLLQRNPTHPVGLALAREYRPR